MSNSDEGFPLNQLQSPATHRQEIKINRGLRSSGLLIAAAILSSHVVNLTAAAAQQPGGQQAQDTEIPAKSNSSWALSSKQSGNQSGMSQTSSQIEPDLYVLGPGDGLSLSFLDPTAGTVGGAISILQDGTATLALLGSVQLTGLTIGQATRWLTSLYGKHLIRPELYLTLTSPRPMKVTILGEVERPGFYPLPGLSTPVSAIQTAGGITLNADVRNVLLRRRISGTDGGQKQTTLDLAELFQFGNQRQNPLLFDGDTLVVGRADKPLPEEVMQLSATNLTPTTINVTVIGEVRSPGTISLRANSPLDDAILKAGGPVDWRANKQNVQLVRLNRNGTKTREVFAYNDKSGVSNQINPPLRNNDVIIVARSLYGKTLDLLNQLIFPTINSVNSVYSIYNNFCNNYSNNNNSSRCR